MKVEGEEEESIDRTINCFSCLLKRPSMLEEENNLSLLKLCCCSFCNFPRKLWKEHFFVVPSTIFEKTLKRTFLDKIFLLTRRKISQKFSSFSLKIRWKFSQTGGNLFLSLFHSFTFSWKLVSVWIKVGDAWRAWGGTAVHSLLDVLPRVSNFTAQITQFGRFLLEVFCNSLTRLSQRLYYASRTAKAP